MLTCQFPRLISTEPPLAKLVHPVGGVLVAEVEAVKEALFTQAGDSAQPNGPFSILSNTPSLSSSKSTTSLIPSPSVSVQAFTVRAKA